MSLHIYIAHTGEHLLADPVSFASPDALRSWIARNTSISSQRQILMTARGKNVRLQTLATENEIFVYDRQYVSEPGSVDLPEIPPPPPLKADNPPDTLADQNDLQAWRNLYMARRTWSLNLAERCIPINEAIQEHNGRTDIIHRGVGVALENLKSHVASLEHKFQEAQAWANDLLKEQKAALDGWQRALEKLETIPARKDLAFLGRPSTPKKGEDRPTGTLQDFLDVNEVRRAASQGYVVSQNFARRLDEIEKAVSNISSDTQLLLNQAQPPHIDGGDGLLEEVETITKKISSDYEHVLGLPSNQKTLANISRMALGHTKDLLPSLLEVSLELQTGLEHAVRQRNAAMKSAVTTMRTVSSLESRLADMQAQITNLDVTDGDVFEVLYAVFHMPIVYGSVLVEAVRRYEWSEKLKSDSLTLAEEMAVFRDEEQRRRKKWLKTTGDLVAFPDDTTPGLEINLQGQGHNWPDMSRKEIETYIGTLKSKNGMTAVVEELTQLYADLDSPTRQQRRRAKAFKQGSLVDMGRSSLLIRGDDMVRSLRDEKSKLEDRLKGSESRIRKLEDLLHRQSHIVRPLSGNFVSDIPTSPASPLPDPLSRRSSISSRRMSSNQSPEDKALVQRIVTLEAELVAERETVQRLQREAHVERQSTTDRMQEAQSTKEDLIKNLEARQREFEDERRFLESNTKNLRVRVEELEEEVERVLDRHEHEKQETDERNQKLEEQLGDAQAKARKELQEAKSQVEKLEKDYNSQKERADGLNNDVLTQKDLVSRYEGKISELRKALDGMNYQKQEDMNALQAAHANLSPDGAVPSDFAKLVKAIEILSEGLAIHARSSEDAAAKVASEKKMLEEKIARMETEVQELRGSAEKRDSEVTQLRNDLLQERSQISVLKAELGDERAQLHHLRSKFAAGETGSEVLRERVAEEERKVTSLSQKLIQVNAQAHNTAEELRECQLKIQTIQESQRRVTTRLESRGTRAQEISRQLHAQIGKFGRMLEQLGFTLVRQDDHITIQRASKVNSSSGVGESLTASGIASVRPDPTLLSWMDGEDPEDEAAKFSAFMNSLAKFNVEEFGESVVKRVKDIEVLARKWQKEARAYRDKYHRAQSEAHDKIAYRSFKDGDLALFLPTRNQAIRSWAAFNVGAPHYFLREQDVHKLSTRDWLLARINKVEERVVDLSRSMNGVNPDRRSMGDVSDGASFDDENPFELSDGLRWYLLDATEEKPGAPSTPGLGKSTVASANVDAKGSIRLKRPSNSTMVAKTLTKSLDSRRDSSASKKGAPVPAPSTGESAGDNVQPAEADAGSQLRESAPIFDEGTERGRQPESQPSTPTSPSTERANAPVGSSPSKRLPARIRPWEKLWSLDYRLDGDKQ